MIEQAGAQGTRHTQEDRNIVVYYPEGTLLAVMDGHGGNGVSERLAEALPAVWAAWLSTPLAIEKVCFQVFRDLAAKTRQCVPGSTLSLVFIPTDEKSAYIAVLGDSPVIAERADGNIFIGPDHNARSNPEERSAATARGGFYEGGYIFASYDGHGLQMTRALGDVFLDRILDRTPEVFHIDLGDFLLIGSDGLFDPSHGSGSSTTAEILYALKTGMSAQNLVDRALAVPTHDNVTVILWRRDQPNVQKS